MLMSDELDVDFYGIFSRVLLGTPDYWKDHTNMHSRKNRNIMNIILH